MNFHTDTDVDKICVGISEAKADYLGYSCYVWNIEKILKVVARLKENSSFVHILGGPEISLQRIAAFPGPNRADYYVVGEGENALKDLMLYLGQKAWPLGKKSLKGVAYFDGGTIIYEENIDRIANLDEIPSAYLEGVLDESLYAGRQAFLETQRGCRFKCKYCVYHKHLSGVSFYSLSRIYAELDFLIVKKQVRALRILDAVFTSDLSRAKKIVQHLLALKKDGVKLPWIYWEFTCDTVDEEFIKLIGLLKEKEQILNTEACLALDRPQLYADLLKDYIAVNSVGIQSFCPQALKAVARASLTRDKIHSFMEMSKKYNIALKIDLIVGLPFETFNSYFAGLEFFLPYFEKTDHVLNIHRLQILPGSELEAMCETYGINYAAVAPRYVLSTPGFPEKELELASKLSAILFRILNSPLRGAFFHAKQRTRKSFSELLVGVFDAAKASAKLNNTGLFRDGFISDEYWNKEIFSEIPSEWLTDLLRAKNVF